MATPTISSNVGVNVNPTGLEKAASSVEKKILDIVKAIERAGKATDNELKSLSIGLKQFDTLRGLTAKLKTGDFTSAQSIGRQARALAEYRAGISKTSDAVGVLRGRLVSLDVANGKLLQAGRLPTKQSLLNAQNIEQTANAYGGLVSKVNSLRGRLGALSNDSRKSLAPLFDQFDKLDKKNATIFGSNRSSFKPQLAQMDSMVQKMTQQVGIAEKAEKAERLKLETLREQGKQLLTNNEYERLSQRAASIRQGQSILRNADLTGTDLTRRGAAMDRLSRATALATGAERQLNAELAKPAAQQNAQRLQDLINRLQTLRREQGLAAAEQIKLNQALQQQQGKGGFFSGVKSVGKNLFDNPEGSGLAFGAGAMVGRVAAYAVATAAIYGTVTALKDAIQFAIQYEDALAQLSAISGATAIETERLSAGILSVSKSSATSVLELTKAATTIAQAGYGGAEIEQMLDSVTKLADASGSTAEDSVDILTSALGSFQLSANEAGRVTDSLVSVLNESKLGISQVQLGIQYLGATAKAENISLEELTAMLGAMADAGVRGSTAATGLRQMFIELMDPSDKLVGQLDRIGLSTADIDVKTLGAVEVLTRLRDAGFDAYHSMETRAAAAYVAISSNIDNVKRLEQATLNQGAAAAAQEKRLDSVNAQWQLMINRFSEVAAAIGRELSPAMKEIIQALEFVGLLVLGVVSGFAKLINILGGYGDQAKTTAVSQAEFSNALMESGLSADETAVLMNDLGDSFSDLETLGNDLEARFSTLKTEQGSLREETAKLILRQDTLATSQDGVAAATATLSSRFPGLRDELAKTQGGIQGLIQAMFALDLQAQRTMASVAAAKALQSQVAMNDARKRADEFSAKSPSGFNGLAYGLTGRKLDPRVAQYDQAVRRKDWAEAMRIAGQSVQVQQLRPDYVEIPKIVNDYFSSESQYKQYTTASETAKFFSDGKAGGLMSQKVLTSTNRASYLKSQGKNTSEVAGQLANQRQVLSNFLNNPNVKLDSGTKAGVQELLAMVVAAENGLRPEPATEKKKGSGRRTRAAGGRGNRDFLRTELDIQKEEAEWKKTAYENILKAFDEAPNFDQLGEIMVDVDDALESWLTAEKEVSLAEIERNKPNAAQKAKLLEAAGKKANQLRIENIDKISDIVEKAINRLIDESTKNLQNSFDNKLRPFERVSSIKQGYVEGLNNPIGNNNTPDYVRTLAQNTADIASDNEGRARLAAGQAQVAALKKLMDDARAARETLNNDINDLKIQQAALPKGSEDEIVVTAKLTKAQDNLRAVDDKLNELEKSTYDLETANLRLKASYDALNLVPTSFGAGLNAAIQATLIEVRPATSFGAELIKGLGEPLKTVHEGFKGFFSDVLTGSQSVAGAFKRMADSIIDSMLQMVAVALANQFFKLFAGFISSALGGPSISGGADLSLGINPSFAWKGGPIKTGGSGTTRVQRLYGGGQVQGGLPTRDSTYIHAAADEYMIRRPAAQSLGKGFLDAINARGADALKGMGATNIVAPQAPPVNTNVYIIAPEEKPQLGPNDVIATISSDVLRGGVMKKLIKQVSNGG